MTTVDRYLRDEAAFVEGRIARLRIGLLVVVGAPLTLFAVATGLRTIPPLAVGLVWLVAALSLERLLAVGGYQRWISVAATLFDAGALTAVVLAIVVVRRDPAFGPTAVHIAMYFPLVALGALRQSRGLALLAGAASAGGYLVLFAVAAIFDPAGVVIGDVTTAGVSVVRVVMTAAALVIVGLLGAVVSSRSHRLLASALNTRTFLFSDLRDFTSFVERNGDQVASELIRTYRTLVRDQIERSGGGEVKTEGDSFYVVFESARQALACGVAIQRAAARGSTAERPIRIGIGIHAGEPVPHDGQFVGSAVNVAARLAQNAAADELLVSDVVRGLLRTSDVPPMHERAVTMKGVTDPPRAYEVLWRE